MLLLLTNLFMKRILQVFIAFIFLSGAAKAQEPAVDWQKVMNLYGPAAFYNVQKSADDSLYFAGINDMSQTPQFPNSAFLSVTDLLANYIWDAVGWPYDNSAYYNVIPMADRRHICGGYFIEANGY